MIGIATLQGMYYSTPVSTISLKLPRLLLERLEAEARGRRSTKSAVVRECLQEVLFRRRGTRKPSCLDLMGDLIGSQRGPKDLSTNKGYLKGLGRERAGHH